MDVDGWSEHPDLSGELHALRDELVAILRAARTLEIRGGRLPRAEQLAHVEDIARRAELVIDALDEALSAPEKVARQRPPVAPVAATANLVAGELEDFARSCRVRLACAVPSGLYAAMPVDALRQILRNLTIDACRFARADSTVQVRARREGGEVLVEVTHRAGAGAEDVRLATLDDAEDASSDGRPGVALTLKVVRALVEAFGGATTVFAEEDRVSFSVRLPGVPAGRGAGSVGPYVGPSQGQG